MPRHPGYVHPAHCRCCTCASRRTNLSTTPADRFWRHVDMRGADECWLWTGERYPTGYGRFQYTVAGVRRTIAAHRYALGMDHTSPRDMLACHRCDNPPCVNPSHLFRGSHSDNTRDAFAKGRRPTGDVRTHCRRGHEFTPETTGRHYGRRFCRVCNNAVRREWRRKRMEVTA